MIGQSLLAFQEQEDVLLKAETTMNDRPLRNQIEEFEKPVPTPNTLLRGEAIFTLEEDLEKIGEENVTKGMRFLQTEQEVYDEVCSRPKGKAVAVVREH